LVENVEKAKITSNLAAKGQIGSGKKSWLSRIKIGGEGRVGLDIDAGSASAEISFFGNSSGDQGFRSGGSLFGVGLSMESGKNLVTNIPFYNRVSTSMSYDIYPFVSVSYSPTDNSFTVDVSAISGGGSISVSYE